MSLEAEAEIDRLAARLIAAAREKKSVRIGGLEDLLREYSLSSEEGLALMVLAESLLRVPDSFTADRLIEDKLAAGQWTAHAGASEPLLVSAAAWALGTHGAHHRQRQDGGRRHRRGGAPDRHGRVAGGPRGKRRS